MSGHKHIQLTLSKETTSKEEISYTGDYSVALKNIIFLPFDNFWQFCILVTVILDTILVVYDITYDHEKRIGNFTDALYYGFSIIYLLDTGLALAHRNMPRYRSAREHVPKHNICVAFDIISLLPIYEGYLLVKAASRIPVPPNPAKDLIRLKILLRLYRVYDFFSQMNYYAGVNRVFAVCVGHYLKLIIVTHLTAAIWYTLKCWKCKKLNWTVNLRYMHFDTNDPWHWFVICYTTIGNTFAHNWRGNIRGEIPIEKLIIIGVMMVGYILHFMVYFGQLTNAYMKASRRRFDFVENVSEIKALLKNLDIEKEWQDKTINYYNVYWDNRCGIKDMPQIFNLLPIPLRKEVTVDIFWEALRHSHLYGEEDISFKRALSLEMKSEFYLAGDYVYRLNNIKSKMVYIVSGILQILTAEDEESPIISFSSGTLLGEIACLLPSKAIANVRCATYCELQTLCLDGLCRSLRYRPGKAKALQAKLKHRINNAKVVHNVAQAKLRKQIKDLAPRVDTAIRWIKHQWRQLSHLNRSQKKLDMVDLKLDPSHTSEYLSLLVLTEKVELKMQVICLKGSCPFIMETNSSFRRFAGYVVVVSVILQCLILPHRIAFKRRISDDIFNTCFFLDIIYFLDIYLKLSTAFKDGEVFITKSSMIIAKRLKDMSFLTDVVATIPGDYIALACNLSPHVVALAKLNRLLKMHAVIHYFNSLENSIWFSDLSARLVKYIFLYVITSYWLTCLMYSFACFYEECFYYGWFNYNRVVDQKYNSSYDSSYAFLISGYYTTTSYLGVGFSMTFHYTPFDLFAHHMLVMLGYYIFTFCFAELCAIFTLRLKKRKKYYEYISGMAEFMKLNNISNVIKQRMMTMIAFWWYLNKDAEIIGKDGILNDATTELKDKVFKERIKRCLADVPLFYKCDDKVLETVTQICTLKTLPHNFPIVTADKRYTWLHIILRGYCKLKSTMPGDYERNTETILRVGDAFPVMEVLHQVPSLVNVTSITATEIIYIRYADLIEILLANPAIGKEMGIILDNHFKTFERCLLRKRGRLPEMIPEEHSLGRGDMFTYEIYDDDQISPEELAYLKPFRELGKWSFIRYFLLRNTIDPSKTFFLCWEISRCIFAFTRATLGLTYFSLLLEYRSHISFLMTFLDISCFFDICVRLHCQYYNEIGILVTHPWATAKHYLRTSFVVDFFAAMPFRQLKIDQMLGYRNREFMYSLLALISRPWQLHRLIGFIHYFQSNIESTKKSLKVLKYFLLVFFALATLTAFIQIFTCTIEPPDDTGHIEFICPNGTWIKISYITEELTPPIMYIYCLYVAISLFTSSTCGTYVVALASEAIFFSTLCALTTFFRGIIFTKLTSEKIGGNVNLTIYQERVRSFLDFVKSEFIDEGLISETISHYQFIWKITQGSDISRTLNKFHADLHEDVVYNLYGSTIEAAEIFQGIDISFCRQLAIHLEVQHFKKDSEIIRCNDVQGLLFLVYKGKVDIIVAKERICTLTRGGIFGCLEKQGVTRQTMTAVAKVHVQVLAINSNLFHSIVGKHVNVAEQLRIRNVLHSEYIEGKKLAYVESETSTRQLPSNASLVKSWAAKIIRKTTMLVKHDGKWYGCWDYIVCVHIATISSIWFMFFTIMTDRHTEIPSGAMSAIYILDMIFIVRIYFQFHLTYTDHNSGIRITDLSLIRIKYIKSLKLFVDLFMCLPLNFFLSLGNVDRWIIKYSLLNRMLRFVYLIQYYNYCQQKLRVKTHLRWTYLTYWICITIQLATCLWWLTACFDGQCYYMKSTAQEDMKKYVKAPPGLDSVLLAYTYTINLFSTTGLREVTPKSWYEVLVSIIILCIFQYNIEALASEFATLLEIGQHSMSNYEYNINQLRIYLKGRQLSPPIVDKVWKYSLQLWQRQRGEWMPAILTEAPGYLKQDLMNALYGYHLHNHTLFMNTHVDFLRQLVVHLKRCVFFPGNYLVEKGDMDGSINFIHEGSVEVFDKHGNNETLSTVLRRGQSFGLEQGLYNIPHTWSYKAKTVVDALILTRTEWEYLLDWFPASKEEIQVKAIENGLRRR